MLVECVQEVLLLWGLGSGVYRGETAISLEELKVYSNLEEFTRNPKSVNAPSPEWKEQVDVPATHNSRFHDQIMFPRFSRH